MILYRHDVVAKIEERLAGKLDDVALAAWAFDHFYAEELGEEEWAEADADVIAAALDELMFADTAGFELDQEGLRALLARLQGS